jgi:hypothetical protein
LRTLLPLALVALLLGTSLKTTTFDFERLLELIAFERGLLLLVVFALEPAGFEIILFTTGSSNTSDTATTEDDLLIFIICL